MFKSRAIKEKKHVVTKNMRGFLLVVVVLLEACSALVMTSLLGPSKRATRLLSTSEEEETPPTVDEEEEEAPPPLARSRMTTSDEWYTRALPWVERPALLDGSLAADAGFDPAGFAASKVDLFNYREAEIKHSRLAMLGAAGWILAEKWDTGIAEALNLPSIIDLNAGRDPSVLNGGLGLISPAYWIAVIVFTGLVEFRGEVLKNTKKEADKTWMLTASWTPGDLGFDPLNLYNTLGGTYDKRSKYLMETAEIKNGRLAMVAITTFVLEEFITKKSVVELTPIFFKPFPQVVEDLMFAAPPLYIQ